MFEFSICIPICNEEESIDRILENIIRDPFFDQASHKEVILGLNGCTDNSLPFAKKWAQKHPWLKLLTLNKKGKNNAWMEMVQAVSLKGPIYFFDADIQIPQGTLQTLFEHLKARPDLDIVSCYSSPFEQSRHRRSFYQRLASKWFYTYWKDHSHSNKGLCGRGYLMRLCAAKKTTLPENEKIADDQYLEALFPSAHEILTSAPVFYEIPRFFEGTKQLARIELSHIYLKKDYANLFSKITFQTPQSQASKIKYILFKKPFFFPMIFFVIARKLLSRYFLLKSIKHPVAHDHWVKIQSSKSY